MLLRRLLHEDQLLRVIPAAGGELQDAIERRGRQSRRARQNPQPLRRAAAHQRPVVLLAQLQHVVVGIEKPEERHPQPPRIGGRARLAAHLLPAAGRRAQTAIDHLDPLRPTHIARPHRRHAPFEGVIEAGDLIPFAHITVQIERGDRTPVHAVGARTEHGTGQKEGYKQQNQHKSAPFRGALQQILCRDQDFTHARSARRMPSAS